VVPWTCQRERMVGGDKSNYTTGCFDDQKLPSKSVIKCYILKKQKNKEVVTKAHPDEFLLLHGDV
jgi:hypothetical protein